MFITGRLVKYLFAIVLLFGLSYLWSVFHIITLVAFIALFAVTTYNTIALYASQASVTAKRICDERLSNGDDNDVSLEITNGYNREMEFEIIDELPFTLQVRDFSIKAKIGAGQRQILKYKIHPTKRGQYVFHNINVYVSTWPNLVQRRFKFEQQQPVKVYPSFSFIHNMELLSVRNRETQNGNKLNIRKLGQSKEFENIREYVVGDDYRVINWKATARRHQLMVNQYVEEQSQNIYAVIDKGRGMQHAFKGLSLLDYSINSALQLSHLVVSHADNAGLITFDREVDTHLAPSRNVKHMHLIMETLFKEKGNYEQSDYSSLYEYIKQNVKRRSLFIIYSTFDRMGSMQRQLPYLKQMAKSNIVLVVFFEDKDIKELGRRKSKTSLEYINSVVAKKFEFEQKMIVNELNRHGIYSLLTAPEHLSANVINRYLEIKARNIL